MDYAPERFEFVGAYEVPFAAPLHVVLDNFSEDEHTPWVHTRLGWDKEHVGNVQFTATNHNDRTEVSYQAPQRVTWLGPLIFLRPGDIFHNDWTTRFDPVRTTYSISWTSSDGRPRPVDTRSVIFFVPETETKTRVVVFTFVRLHERRLLPLMPIIRRATLILGRWEVLDDQRFIPVVANTPFELKNMRLGRYDKPLIHNHKLLKRIYLGETEVDAETATQQ
jgi:hypothetical protein